MGRIQLYSTPFETYERNIRDQLARMLAPGGFDPARDILEITLNRWPHGYAYEYNSLFDPFWLDGRRDAMSSRAPTVRPPRNRQRRRRRLRVHDCAIDQGYRAVQELKKI